MVWYGTIIMLHHSVCLLCLLLLLSEALSLSAHMAFLQLVVNVDRHINSTIDCSKIVTVYECSLTILSDIIFVIHRYVSDLNISSVLSLITIGCL